MPRVLNVHRLLEGGASADYLPFAQSKLNALVKNYRGYPLTQVFIDGGTEIHVRVENETTGFIRITGGTFYTSGFNRKSGDPYYANEPVFTVVQADLRRGASAVSTGALGAYNTFVFPGQNGVYADAGEYKVLGSYRTSPSPVQIPGSQFSQDRLDVYLVGPSRTKVWEADFLATIDADEPDFPHAAIVQTGKKKYVACRQVEVPASNPTDMNSNMRQFVFTATDDEGKTFTPYDNFLNIYYAENQYLTNALFIGNETVLFFFEFASVARRSGKPAAPPPQPPIIVRTSDGGQTYQLLSQYSLYQDILSNPDFDHPSFLRSVLIRRFSFDLASVRIGVGKFIYFSDIPQYFIDGTGAAQPKNGNTGDLYAYTSVDGINFTSSRITTEFSYTRGQPISLGTNAALFPIVAKRQTGGFGTDYYVIILFITVDGGATWITRERPVGLAANVYTYSNGLNVTLTVPAARKDSAVDPDALQLAVSLYDPVKKGYYAYVSSDGGQKFVQGGLIFETIGDTFFRDFNFTPIVKATKLGSTAFADPYTIAEATP